jgi:hypothetical protein
MTSPEVRSLNIIRIPRAAWLAMSRLFTQARTCRRACALTHLSLPLPHLEGLSTRACDLVLALLFPAFSQLISDRSFVEQ